MRTALKDINQVRKKFRGIYQREGKKTNWHGYSEPTVLLRRITDDTGKVVADHLWFGMTKGFDALGELKTGDVIEFEARVTPYKKGYVNRKIDVNKRSTDYKLSRPTKFQVIRQNEP